MNITANVKSRGEEIIRRHPLGSIASVLGIAFLMGIFVQWAVFSGPTATDGKDQVSHEEHAGHTQAGGMRTLSISPEAKALMNLQTTEVEREYVTHEIRMVGKVTYDETRLGYITAWIPGRLDRLYVDFTGVKVNKGDHMAYVYSEKLYAAQEELIQAIKSRKERPESPIFKDMGIDLVEASREKLRLLGLTDEQIQKIETQDKPSDHITIYAPMGGVVIEKLKQEGDRVQIGDRIYTVADLNQVWVMLDAYESDLVWLRYGQQVTFTTEAYPGEKFIGRIAFIQPVLNDKTRTVKVRVNVPNPEGKLKPEMFVRGLVRTQVAAGGRVLDPDLAGKWISPMHPEIVDDEPGKCPICGMPMVRAESLGYVAARADESSKPIVIPKSAALVTGTRAIVYVELPDTKMPTYEGREIVLGPRAGDYYLVRHGLQPGERVVTRGNFKIDAEIQIQAKPSMMTPEGGGGGGHAHGGHGDSKPKGEKTAPAAPLKLPPDFIAQIKSLNAAYRAVNRAVESENLARVRREFGHLGDALQKISDKKLTGHGKMLWNELSMLLENDAVEGHDVGELEDAKIVWKKLSRHMERVRGLLSNAAMMHETPALRKMEVPQSFQQQLASIWAAYLKISEALAADRFPQAQQQLAGLQNAVKRVDSSKLSEEVRAVWEKEQANLSKIQRELEAAKDLNSLRNSFALLSDEVGVLARRFGFGEKVAIYQMHCPMVFQGRGAIWLQDSPKTANPYFGSSMLNCADRVIPINPSDTHEDHQERHE